MNPSRGRLLRRASRPCYLPLRLSLFHLPRRLSLCLLARLQQRQQARRSRRSQQLRSQECMRRQMHVKSSRPLQQIMQITQEQGQTLRCLAASHQRESHQRMHGAPQHGALLRGTAARLQTRPAGPFRKGPTCPGKRLLLAPVHHHHRPWRKYLPHLQPPQSRRWDRCPRLRKDLRKRKTHRMPYTLLGLGQPGHPQLEHKGLRRPQPRLRARRMIQGSCDSPCTTAVRHRNRFFHKIRLSRQ